MGMHEVAQGSWAVGNIPRHRESGGIESTKQRRTSLQLGGADSASLRNALRNPGHTFNLEAVAGMYPVAYMRFWFATLSTAEDGALRTLQVLCVAAWCDCLV